MPKCQLCGYSSRKKSQFFRCWNKETKLGCKRYTCNNCVFITKEITKYENFICPNSFCNEEYGEELIVGLKQWFEPKKKIDFEDRLKLLTKREKEVVKGLKHWEEKISSATKRTVFASQKASEREQFMTHSYQQLHFNLDYYSSHKQEHFTPSWDMENSYLTKVSVSLDPKLEKFQPCLRLFDNGRSLLDLQLAGLQQEFLLNHPIRGCQSSLSVEIRLMRDQDWMSGHEGKQWEEQSSAIVTLEFVGA